jgi:hypothetical protein
LNIIRKIYMKTKYLIFIFQLIVFSAATAVPIQDRGEVVPGAARGSYGSLSGYGVLGQPIVGTESYAENLKNEFGLFYVASFGFKIVTTAVTFPGGSTIANSGGQIVDDNLQILDEHGICYSTLNNPSLTQTTGGGVITTAPASAYIYASQMTGLTAGQVYYVVAYAKHHPSGDPLTITTDYGQVVSFTTIPTLPTWGLIAFVTLVAGFGGWVVWRRS